MTANITKALSRGAGGSSRAGRMGLTHVNEVECDLVVILVRLVQGLHGRGRAAEGGSRVAREEHAYELLPAEARQLDALVGDAIDNGAVLGGLCDQKREGEVRGGCSLFENLAPVAIALTSGPAAGPSPGLYAFASGWCRRRFGRDRHGDGDRKCEPNEQCHRPISPSPSHAAISSLERAAKNTCFQSQYQPIYAIIRQDAANCNKICRCVSCRGRMVPKLDRTDVKGVQAPQR